MHAAIRLFLTGLLLVLLIALGCRQQAIAAPFSFPGGLANGTTPAVCASASDEAEKALTFP
ncbi:MAG TPA: hypothetical protein VLC53_06815 [Myxococcota bacterium]|nr:hypothetical protein [Myxococcota bacterium]